MNEATIILRRWSSRIRNADEADCTACIEMTGLKDYQPTRGQSRLPDVDAQTRGWHDRGDDVELVGVYGGDHRLRRR
jgi:hypothetical protein